MPEVLKYGLVEIDLDELERARAALQTDGIKSTVNAALREVGRRAALHDAAEYVLSGRMDVPDLDAWAASREPKR